MTATETFGDFLRKIGRPCLNGIDALGNTALFMLEGLAQIFASPKIFPRTMQQLFVIGSKSLFLIMLIGVFCGMVLGLQGYYTMTAEIGVMRITDQIDALDVMDINSMGYLVSPRLLASLIAFPLLTAVFDVIGIIGGYLTGVLMLGINEGAYFYRITSSVTATDVNGGFIKAVLFGLLVTTICCRQGYYTNKRRDSVGPEAVGNATTSAVVISCVLILAADYIVTSFLL